MPEYSHEAGVTEVSESDKAKNDGWGHRSEMSRSSHDKERAKSIGQVVEERRQGETITGDQEAQALSDETAPEWHGKRGEDSDPQNPDAKDTKSRYEDKYGDMVSEEMKSKLREKRIEAMKEQASNALDSTTKN